MLQTKQWEHPLLDLADAAMRSDRGAQADHHVLNAAALSTAYAHCQDITRVHSKTFSMASELLPVDKRRAIRALYGFCRVSDDLVDTAILEDFAEQSAGMDPAGVDQRAQNLEAWRQQVIGGMAGANGSPVGQVALAWADARRAYDIPRGYVEQLLDGLTLDLHRVRYETFAELARYCYGVACTVGLMSMHIIGYSGREAVPYAIRLGVALQLTNILRDVGEDWRAGRLYLPAEELRAFDLSEADIAAGQVDARWRAFMRFQIERAHRLYQDALPGVQYLSRDGRFAIAAAGELYRAILTQIEKNDYDVFSRRASTGAWGKLRRLPGIWWRSR